MAQELSVAHSLKLGPGSWEDDRGGTSVADPQQLHSGQPSAAPMQSRDHGLPAQRLPQFPFLLISITWNFHP